MTTSLLQTVQNLIANLESGAFKILIMDDGSPRDVTAENIQNLKRAVQKAERAAPHITKALDLSLQHLEQCNDYDADSAEIGAEAIQEIRNANKFL